MHAVYLMHSGRLHMHPLELCPVVWWSKLWSWLLQHVLPALQRMHGGSRHLAGWHDGCFGRVEEITTWIWVLLWVHGYVHLYLQIHEKRWRYLWYNRKQSAVCFTQFSRGTYSVRTWKPFHLQRHLHSSKHGRIIYKNEIKVTYRFHSVLPLMHFSTGWIP